MTTEIWYIFHGFVTSFFKMYFSTIHFHCFWFNYLVIRYDNFVFDYVSNIFNKVVCEAVKKRLSVKLCNEYRSYLPSAWRCRRVL